MGPHGPPGSNPAGVRDFFSFVWAHFLSRANAQKVSFGIFIRALQFTTFKPPYNVICLIVLSGQTLLKE